MMMKLSGKKLAIAVLIAIALLLVGVGLLVGQNFGSKESKNSTNKAVVDNDLVIQTKNVTEKAVFYPVKIEGTNMEVIAVKASDGTIRTAFNTCQVCNNSGKGYYKVQGNQLVCQNCGNRFGMDDVEVTKGGCNPVPITDELKSVNNDTITISKDVLKQATVLFQTWK